MRQGGFRSESGTTETISWTEGLMFLKFDIYSTNQQEVSGHPQISKMPGTYLELAPQIYPSAYCRPSITMAGCIPPLEKLSSFVRDILLSNWSRWLNKLTFFSLSILCGTYTRNERFAMFHFSYVIVLQCWSLVCHILFENIIAFKWLARFLH